MIGKKKLENSWKSKVGITDANQALEMLYWHKRCLLPYRKWLSRKSQKIWPQIAHFSMTCPNKSLTSPDKYLTSPIQFIKKIMTKADAHQAVDNHKHFEILKFFSNLKKRLWPTWTHMLHVSSNSDHSGSTCNAAFNSW